MGPGTSKHLYWTESAKGDVRSRGVTISPAPNFRTNVPHPKQSHEENLYFAIDNYNKPGVYSRNWIWLIVMINEGEK